MAQAVEEVGGPVTADAPSNGLEAPRWGDLQARSWERLRRRSRSVAPGLTDVDLVALLGLTGEQGRAEALAAALVRRFGSAAGVLGATCEALAAVEGMTRCDALRLKAVHAAACTLAREAWARRPSCRQRLAAYLRATRQFQTTHDLAAIYMDQRMHVIADEVVGAPDLLAHERGAELLVLVAQRALQLGATMVMAVESRPCGGTRPTAAAVDRYRTLWAMLKAIGIILTPYRLLTHDGLIKLKPELLH